MMQVVRSLIAFDEFSVARQPIHQQDFNITKTNNRRAFVWDKFILDCTLQFWVG